MKTTRQMQISMTGYRTSVQIPVDELEELRKFEKVERERILKDCIANPKKYLEEE